MQKFAQKFVEDVKNPKKQKQGDLTLKETISGDPVFGQQFMLMLLERWEHLKEIKMNFPTPKAVTELSEVYMNESNDLAEYIAEWLEIDEDSTDFYITAGTLYEDFKNSEHYAVGSKKDSKWFKKQMTANGYEVVKKTTSPNKGSMVYFGIKLKPIEWNGCEVGDEYDK